MRATIIFFLSLFSLNLISQEFEEVKYKLDLPQGWFIERINFPINFAPELLYKGGEDLRFPPGWGKATHENYWSYAFLWCLEGEVKTDTASLTKDMKVYYQGLIATNGRTITPEKLIPIETSFKETKTSKGDVKTFAGTIKMTDYMSKNPMTLNCKVHLRTCPGENKTFLFFELSPKATTHAVWKALDKLWFDFKCKK